MRKNFIVLHDMGCSTSGLMHSHLKHFSSNVTEIFDNREKKIYTQILELSLCRDEGWAVLSADWFTA